MYMAAMFPLLVTVAAGVSNRFPALAYGHAYQAPGDFTDQEIEEIASRFPVFTVEKRHAFGVYGDPSAPAGSPHRYNSIRAAVETARRIKAVNPDAKVLMYWNSAIHFNMYECETEVNASWLMPPDFHAGTSGKGLYDYSVPEFRHWWVRCASDAILDSDGMLDGLFLDALPKVDWQQGLRFWNTMVNSLSAKIGEQHLVMYNGFYLPHNGRISDIIAGADQLAHANLYCESFGLSVTTPDNDVVLGFLGALQTALAQNPSKILFGHGDSSQAEFHYIYGSFLMVAPKAGAYFLGNEGYRVDQGLLDDHVEYGLLLGAPLGHFQVNGLMLSRNFKHGSVRVCLKTRTASFSVGPPPTPSPAPPAPAACGTWSEVCNACNGGSNSCAVCSSDLSKWQCSDVILV